MVPPSSARVSRVPAYSGSRHAALPFAYGALTLSGWLSQNHSARLNSHFRGPLPRHARAPVWPPPLSLAATYGIDVSFFSLPYLDVSVQAVPLRTLWIHVRMHEVFSCGFPHSDTCGSMDMCSSPQLFAACRVFLRLSVPRHPPCALTCLTTALCIALHMAFLLPLILLCFRFVRTFFVSAFTCFFLDLFLDFSVCFTRMS